MGKTLEDKNIFDEIIKLGWPVIIENLLGTLFGMVDMIMLGNYGTEQMAAAGISAVGITNQYVAIGLALVQALNVGGTTMISRYLGAARREEIEPVVKHVILLTQIILVVPFLFLGIGYTYKTMGFLGGNKDMMDIGGPYFKVITIGFIFQAFNFSISACLRGVGDTKTPMQVNLLVNFLNVLGNAVLIYGLLGFKPMGILGAGISTSISHVLASIILVFYIFKKESLISIDLDKKFKFNENIVYNLIKIGVPASLEQMALRLGLLLFTRIVSTLGTLAFATHQICINIFNLSFVPGQAFGTAASTLTGRSLGEERPELAEKFIESSALIGGVFSLVIGCVFFFLGRPFISLYTSNIGVIDEGSQILKLLAFMQPIQAVQLIITGGLRGAGDTIWTLIITIIGMLFIRTICTYVFIMVFELGLIGAWLGVFIDQIIRSILIYLRFRTNRWKEIEIR